MFGNVDRTEELIAQIVSGTSKTSDRKRAEAPAHARSREAGLIGTLAAFSLGYQCQHQRHGSTKRLPSLIGSDIFGV